MWVPTSRRGVQGKANAPTDPRDVADALPGIAHACALPGGLRGGHGIGCRAPTAASLHLAGLAQLLQCNACKLACCPQGKPASQHAHTCCQQQMLLIFDNMYMNHYSMYMVPCPEVLPSDAVKCCCQVMLPSDAEDLFKFSRHNACQLH